MDGVTTLNGAVDSALARRTAMDLAHRAGARKVRDELRVRNRQP